VPEDPQYKVITLGSALRGFSDADLETLLNTASAEGWEPCEIIPRPNSNRLLVILRRALPPRRQPSRKRSWP
jgi:hypothetical protein